MLRTLLLTSLALVAGFGIRALGTQESSAAPPRVEEGQEKGLPPLWYAVLLRPGKTWNEELPPSEQEGIDDHLDHLVQQFQNGHLVLGGPFLDDSGALAVLRAAGLDEARKIAAADPAVKAGLLKVESVHPWLVPLSALVERKAEQDPEEGNEGGEGGRRVKRDRRASPEG